MFQVNFHSCFHKWNKEPPKPTLSSRLSWVWVSVQAHRLQSPAVELTLQHCTAPKHVPGNKVQTLSWIHLLHSCFIRIFGYSCFPSSRKGCPTLETTGPGVTSEERPGKTKQTSPWDPCPSCRKHCLPRYQTLIIVIGIQQRNKKRKISSSSKTSPCAWDDGFPRILRHACVFPRFGTLMREAQL